MLRTAPWFKIHQGRCSQVSSRSRMSLNQLRIRPKTLQLRYRAPKTDSTSEAKPTAIRGGRDSDSWSGNHRLTLFSEVGRNLSKWPAAAHFSSWLALCPDNDISGGRVLWRGARKAKNPSWPTLPTCRVFLRSQPHANGIPSLADESKTRACCSYQRHST